MSHEIQEARQDVRFTKRIAGMFTIGLLVFTMAACTVGGGNTKVSPSSQAAAERQAAKLRQQNLILRDQQVRTEKELGDLKKILRSEQEENRRFREMMATNFDLLEQSVAVSLTKTGGKSPVVSPKDLRLPEPTEPSPRVQPKQPNHVVDPADNSQVSPERVPQSAPKIETPLSLPERRKMAGGEAIPVDTREVSNPAMSSRGNLSTTPVVAAMGDSQPETDSDLRPPLHPRQLRPHPEAKRLYEKGFNHFARKEYDQAVLVYEDFLERFPEDIYSDNAQFWIAEAYFRQNKLNEAEEAYRKVLRHYEHRSTLEGYKTPEALYRLGVTYLRRQNAKQARVFLADVVARFPESSAGRKAKRELGSLAENTADLILPSGPDS